MNAANRLITSFTGTGVLSAAPLLELCEALERRGVHYHKAIPARIEVARDRAVEDYSDRLGEGTSWERRIRLEWSEFHTEPPLSQKGLEGFREMIGELPPGLRGLRILLGYTLPGHEAGPVELTVLYFESSRWEVQLSFPAEPFLDAAKPGRGRAAGLLVADLGEALYDVLSPPYGAMRFDAGVLQSQLPRSGWSFLCATLVERAGREQVEALAQRCYKSWELADGGWFLATSPLDEVDEVLEEEKTRLLATTRHLTLEGMRGAGWKPN